LFVWISMNVCLHWSHLFHSPFPLGRLICWLRPGTLKSTCWRSFLSEFSPTAQRWNTCKIVLNNFSTIAFNDFSSRDFHQNALTRLPDMIFAKSTQLKTVFVRFFQWPRRFRSDIFLHSNSQNEYTIFFLTRIRLLYNNMLTSLPELLFSNSPLLEGVFVTLKWILIQLSSSLCKLFGFPLPSYFNEWHWQTLGIYHQTRWHDYQMWSLPKVPSSRLCLYFLVLQNIH
jgi:hypothetical protein